MTTTGAPAWTRRPATEANRRPRWPAYAEDFEPAVELSDGWKRQEDDPRPLVGCACGGEYNSHEIGDGGGSHRYECVRCGLGKVLATTHGDRRRQIKFACPACRRLTYHNPAGTAPEMIRLFDAGEDADGAAGDAEVSSRA